MRSSFTHSRLVSKYHAWRVQAEQKLHGQIKAATSGTEEQRQHTLAANRKIGVLEGALATSKEKHTAEVNRCARLEKQIDEMRTELRRATSNKDLLEGEAAQRQERVLALEDEIRVLKSEQACASAKALDQQDGFERQVRAVQP